MLRGEAAYEWPQQWNRGKIGSGCYGCYAATMAVQGTW